MRNLTILSSGSPLSSNCLAMSTAVSSVTSPCTGCTGCTGLLEALKAATRKYIDFPDPREYTLVALWTVGTYLMPIWPAYAYLGISGDKRTGKSKLLHLIGQLAFNAVFSVNISTAGLYRIVQSLMCTVLIDEAEALSSPERKMEIKNILYAGYKRGGKVFRSAKTSKERIVPEAFEVFGGKAFVVYLSSADRPSCCWVSAWCCQNKSLSKSSSCHF